MANAQFWQAEHKVYPPSKIHPGVHKGYIRTGVIHNLIRLCPLTALQFWTPMVALASYATWRYRAEVAEWLDNLSNVDYPKWLAEREIAIRHVETEIFWRIEGHAQQRSQVASGQGRAMLNKAAKASYDESEASRLSGAGVNELLK
eukprot:GGOE01036105.1.p1 GENE.GGOE01036105.1~~GGOE01036105.1.p1  ORF type:complete len:160 (+),score=52.46 GGOE01036105.1:45-482(+)